MDVMCVKLRIDTSKLKEKRFVWYYTAVSQASLNNELWIPLVCFRAVGVISGDTDALE